MHSQTRLARNWKQRMWRIVVPSVCLPIAFIAADYKNVCDLLAYAASRPLNLEKSRLSHPDYVAIRNQFARDRHAVQRHVTLFIGDSLTFGLRPDRTEFPHAVNRAIKGDTTLGILTRMEDDLTDLDLESVFLMIGYNDLKFRSNERILDNLDQIVSRFRTDRMVVQSVLPIDPRRRWLNWRIVSLNEMIWDRYRDSNKVKLLNLYPVFKDPKSLGIQLSLTRDGVHLTEDGYRRWADCLQKYHQANLK
jgi:lysophospholipase L1-like esterase